MTQTPAIAVLVGSLRKQSINRQLAEAIAQAVGDKAAFEFLDIGDLGLFNQDLEADFPARWSEFKRRIEAADALLFVTPEYNRSLPGVLKNALDIGSRPWGKNSFAGKPGALIGASPGKTGTAMAQQHARNILSYLDVRLMPQPEAYVQIGDAGIDAGTRDFVSKFAGAFLDWIAAQRE